MKYIKPPTSLPDQLQRLSDRGLHVADRDHAVHVLERISYYRLSAYWAPFKQSDDVFEPGADFDTVLALYEFDRKLRLAVMDAIERVEIAVRTAIIHELSQAHGTFAHLDYDHFHPEFDHAAWLCHAQTEARRSKELFIEHYKKSYEGFPHLPIWMALEVVSLGGLSKLFGGLRRDDQVRIASSYGVAASVLASWLHALTYVRNLCAHHGRLWNRLLGISPALPRHELFWRPPYVPHNKRLWMVLLVLRRLMDHHHQGDDWQQRVETLVEPIASNPRWRLAMGLPEEWCGHPLWQIGWEEG